MTLFGICRDNVFHFYCFDFLERLLSNFKPPPKKKQNKIKELQSIQECAREGAPQKHISAIATARGRRKKKKEVAQYLYPLFCRHPPIENDGSGALQNNQSHVFCSPFFFCFLVSFFPLNQLSLLVCVEIYSNRCSSIHQHQTLTSRPEAAAAAAVSLQTRPRSFPSPSNRI